ncbi:MAG: hypothetical protein R3D66_04845 [Alphaproteobacteria bacterium]
MNSVLANASLLRGHAEQGSSARSFTANPDRVQEAPQAPFVSPYIIVDTNFDRAVLQIRDSNTGDVLRQFPSESALRARQSQEALESAESLFDQPDEGGETGASDAGTPEIAQRPALRLGLFDGAQLESVSPSSPGVAEAQIASAAFSAQSSAQSTGTSGAVSVTA